MDASGDVTNTTQPVIIESTQAPSAGGHYLDTGDGPALVDAQPEDDQVPELPSPQAAAWTTYETHRRHCSQCQTSVWRCQAGDDLFAAYLGAAS
jgi:hypothetical protein